MQKILFRSAQFILWLILVHCGAEDKFSVDSNTQVAAPVITTQPASQTVSIGQQVTFTVTVTGPDSLRYQWSRNNIPIQDATTPSYTTAPVTSADNGANFRVTVSSSEDSVISNQAIITVLDPEDVIDPATIIASDDPGVSDLRFEIFSAENRKPISPFIYGINFYDGINPPNLTLTRLGGNRWTAYNWENNASNAGTDWGPYSNDSYLGGDNIPGEAVRPTIQAGREDGYASLITLQLQGYVSADKTGVVNPAVPNYLRDRFKTVVYRKGRAFTMVPDVNDGNVYMDEFVNFLKRSFPADLFSNPTTPLLISLDNEPELWNITHNILQANRPTPNTYIGKFIALADAIKDIAPDAKIFGPVHYGFTGMVNWQGAQEFNSNFWFTDKFLEDMKTASDTTGHRLLDVYDFHWYSEAQGEGQRVVFLTNNVLTDGQADAVIQAPRSLYDGNYRENSWIAGYLNAPINLLPRIQAKIDAAYPGTKIAITEYGHGGDRHIAGAIAQADTLGAFGQQGVYAATLWPLVPDLPFVYAGFKMFRDFDGHGSSFGATSIRATNPDFSKASLWASVMEGSDDRVVLVLINKSKLNQIAGLQLHHTQRLGRAEVYVLSGPNPTPQRRADMRLTLVNALRYTMPAWSVTTLVLKP